MLLDENLYFIGVRKRQKGQFRIFEALIIWISECINKASPDFNSLHFQISANCGQPSRQAASGGRMNPCDGTLRASELVQSVTQAAQSLTGLFPLSWARKTVGNDHQPGARWISFFQFCPVQNSQRFNDEAFSAGFVQAE